MPQFGQLAGECESPMSSSSFDARSEAIVEFSSSGFCSRYSLAHVSHRCTMAASPSRISVTCNVAGFVQRRHFFIAFSRVFSILRRPVITACMVAPQSSSRGSSSRFAMLDASAIWRQSAMKRCVGTQSKPFEVTQSAVLCRDETTSRRIRLCVIRIPGDESSPVWLFRNVSQS